MNKDIFLMRLEQLLYEIPREEREEAMDYYRSYFDDAGEENEAAVLEELESPQKIAESIQEALSSTGDMAGALKNPPQLREGQSGKYQYGRQTADGRQKSQDMFSGSDFQKESGETNSQASGAGYQKTSGTASYRRYDQYDGKHGRRAWGGMDKRTKLILFIIAAVFLLPVWGTAVSGVLGIIGAAIAVVAVLGVFSVGGVIGGIACTVLAIIRLCALSIGRGLFLLGAGMLLIAASGISVVLLLLLCGRLLPWAVRQIIRFFQWILQWGRSAA